jgi:glycine oxidase
MADVDVAVLGSGVIGLSCAWSLARAGHSVLLVDDHPASGASYVAAGMIAPISEATYGEQAVGALSVAAAACWPEFAEALERTTGRPSGYARTGTLELALDSGDRAVLAELLEYQRSLGMDASWCTPSAAREIEPLVSPQVQGGVFAKADHQADNRALLSSLADAAALARVWQRKGRGQLAFDESGAIKGIEIDGEVLEADAVLVAAGHASAALLPESIRSEVPVRPVKGQILRLHGGELARLSVTVRGLVHGRSVYVVPRRDGKIVVGATVEEKGADLTLSAGAIRRLLDDAIELVPVLEEAEFLEASAGLRPGTPDNVPIVGETSIPRLYVATGHYRNGILFAPFTAALITALIGGDALAAGAEQLSPERFA